MKLTSYTRLRCPTTSKVFVPDPGWTFHSVCPLCKTISGYGLPNHYEKYGVEPAESRAKAQALALARNQP